jgi:hypothetical protein
MGGMLCQGERQLRGKPGQPSATLSVIRLVDYCSRDYAVRGY